MIFHILGILIGIAILVSGIYFLIKEKEDQESRKIYTVTAVVGLVITAAIILQWVLG